MFYKRRKKAKSNKNYSISLASLIIMVSVLMISMGFSAFQTTLEMEDINAIVRLQEDIRVTGISVSDSTSDAVSSWEEYNVKNILSNLYLPYSNSTITYQVEITNLGNVEMGIFELTGLPSNLYYSIDSNTYTLKNILCDSTNSSKCKLGSVSLINVTIGYNENEYDSENTNFNINLGFDFRKFYAISYDGFSNTTNLPKHIMEGEIKTLTFNNSTYIPSDVYIDGALGTYTSPTLTLSNAQKDITVYRKYLINYVLNEGTQAENQINYISSAESITLLDPTREDYSFSGWYDNPELEGESIKVLSDVNSDITLYASWYQYDYYVEESQFNGKVESVIDTGVMLYSAENVNKNFQIKFTVESYDSSYDTPTNINNNTPPTILSSMNEEGSPWPGFVFRLVSNSGATKYSLKINDSHVDSALKYYALTVPYDVEIIREDGIIYTKINSDMYNKVLEYDSSIDTFNVPLTIGGNIDANGNYSRVFKGELSNVSVRFYEGSLLSADYSYTETKTSNSYNLTGTINFDGTNYIDTGINLFSAENINKDFEISLTLKHLGTNAAQATLINLKDESKDKVWPGVSYRLKNNNNLEFTARWPGQTAVNVLDSLTVPKKIEIARRSGVIYYSIDDSAETKLISVPPASLSGTFNSNLTFGASTSSSGTPFRYFVGVVSDIDVILYDN